MSEQLPLTLVVDPKHTALTFVRARPGVFRADFAEWLEANWHVWTTFDREATRIWKRGRRHYSARTIVEWLRHETAVAEQGGEFKLNGNFVPDMSRLWAMFEPGRDGFFETRVMPASKRAA